MLKGWKRKVRITSAISRAWMTTRIVSPRPLSVLVGDVTLIASCSRLRPLRGGRTSPREQRFASRSEELVLILIVRANSGANPNSPVWEYRPVVLDGCAQLRNKWSYQNFLCS